MTIPRRSSPMCRNRSTCCHSDRNEKRFRSGLVFKAHRWLYHSTLGSRAKKEEEKSDSESFNQAASESGSAATMKCLLLKRRMRSEVQSFRQSEVRSFRHSDVQEQVHLLGFGVSGLGSLPLRGAPRHRGQEDWTDDRCAGHLLGFQD